MTINRIRVVPTPQTDPIKVEPLTEVQLKHIEMRYRIAHAAGDLGCLAILAVEHLPALIMTARSKIDDRT